MCHQGLPVWITGSCGCVRLILARRRCADVVAVYRPQKLDMSQFVSSLDSDLLKVQGNTNRLLCLVGDFNAKSTLWYADQVTDNAGRLLEDFVLSSGLSQVVSGPTHLVDGKLASQLDLMFINKPLLVDKCFGQPPLSDHCPTILKGPCHKRPG